MSEQLIFGIHAVTAAITQNAADVKQLWLANVAHNQRLKRLAQSAQHQGIVVTTSSMAELDAMTGGARHQGVVAQLAVSTVSLTLEMLLERCPQPFLLILDGVQDPHNLGACLRTADAAGVDAVIAPKDKAVGMTPVVRKVASGAAESVPFIQVTNLARAMRMLQQQGVWLIGADQAGASSVFAADLSGAVALVMGAEGQGLRRLTRENCDYLVSIPMAGQVSSLNVSVAAGICLFEAVRQRSQALAK